MLKETIIRDPIYGFIDVSVYPFVLEIIKQPQFQRLRRISQLGVSVFVYPSATHNRFNHSVGSMQLFLNIFDHIFKNQNEKDVKKLRKIGVATILLHDIGHGPFSHATESIFGYDHEDFSIEIIKKHFGSILNVEDVDVNDLERIINKERKDKKKVLVQLINSSLDVDRLDYLSRDIYFSGVGFGGIDLNRIIRTMSLYKENKENYLKGYIVIEEKGIHAIESYLLTRTLMYKDVYYHKTTRCVEGIIKNIFKRVKELSKRNKIKLPNELLFLKGDIKMNIEDLLCMDDYYIYSKFSEWSKDKDDILSDLCKRIINRNLFKAIESTQGSQQFIEKIDKIENALRTNGFDGDKSLYYYIIDTPEERPYNPISSITKNEDIEEALKKNIYIKSNDGSCKEISTVSDVIMALKNAKDITRLYIPREIYSEIKNIVK